MTCVASQASHLHGSFVCTASHAFCTEHGCRLAGDVGIARETRQRQASGATKFSDLAISGYSQLATISSSIFFFIFFLCVPFFVLLFASWCLCLRLLHIFLSSLEVLHRKANTSSRTTGGLQSTAFWDDDSSMLRAS